MMTKSIALAFEGFVRLIQKANTSTMFRLLRPIPTLQVSCKFYSKVFLQLCQPTIWGALKCTRPRTEDPPTPRSGPSSGRHTRLGDDGLRARIPMQRKVSLAWQVAEKPLDQVDFARAYDNISHAARLLCERRSGVPVAIIAGYARELCTTELVFSQGAWSTRPISRAVSLRQGCRQ